MVAGVRRKCALRLEATPNKAVRLSYLPQKIKKPNCLKVGFSRQWHFQIREKLRIADRWTIPNWDLEARRLLFKARRVIYAVLLHNYASDKESYQFKYIETIYLNISGSI